MLAGRPRLVLSIGVLLAALGLLLLYGRPPQHVLTGLAEVVDGDSLRLQGQDIRLLGMDAPELAQTCVVSGRTEACGRAARQRLARMVAGDLVTCVWSERDRYGRLLAECRVRGSDLGAAMVRDGQAVAAGRYGREEREAQARYEGLWAGEFVRPRDWRAARGH